MIKIGPSFSAIITRTDRWIVSLSGEIDAAARSELLSLAELLSKLGGSIDFDLTEVSFIDAAGWASVRAGSRRGQRVWQFDPDHQSQPDREPPDRRHRPQPCSSRCVAAAHRR